MSVLSGRAVLAGLLLFAAAGVLPAAPLSPEQRDARLRAIVVRTVNTGVDLFNSGDRDGCYRLYQGSLFAMEAFLGHRPSLQKAVRQAIEDAEGMRAPRDRAIALRRVLDRVYAEVRGADGKATGKPLYDRLGGKKAIEAVVDDLVARAAKNPKVNFTRKGTDGEWEASPANVARLKKHLVQFVAVATGGPKKYEGQDMKAAHKGMAITDAEFDALAADLVASLDKFKVPKKEKDELLAIVGTTRKAIVEKN